MRAPPRPLAEHLGPHSGRGPAAGAPGCAAFRAEGPGREHAGQPLSPVGPGPEPTALRSPGRVGWRPQGDVGGTLTREFPLHVPPWVACLGRRKDGVGGSGDWGAVSTWVMLEAREWVRSLRWGWEGEGQWCRGGVVPASAPGTRPGGHPHAQAGPTAPVPSSRRVWIEKESINSVAISDAPEDLHQRVLVAASLSVNATGECGWPSGSSPLRRPRPGASAACGLGCSGGRSERGAAASPAPEQLPPHASRPALQRGAVQVAALQAHRLARRTGRRPEQRSRHGCG